MNKYPSRAQNLFLLSAFLLLLGIGVVTVLLPELQDTSPEKDAHSSPVHSE